MIQFMREMQIVPTFPPGQAPDVPDPDVKIPMEDPPMPIPVPKDPPPAPMQLQ